MASVHSVTGTYLHPRVTSAETASNTQHKYLSVLRKPKISPSLNSLSRFLPLPNTRTTFRRGIQIQHRTPANHCVRCSSSISPDDVSTQIASTATHLSTVDLTDAMSSLSSIHSSVLTALELSNWSLGVGVGLPCTLMDCGDHFHRSTLNTDDSLKLTIGGILLVSLTVGYLFSTPGVLAGFVDMFLMAPLERYIRPKVTKDDLVLGRKMGEGAFGTVYRASFVNKPDSELVVKRANEFGAVETWMNERVRRACPDACATFVSGFIEKSKFKEKEDFWIVFKYEGNETLAKVIEAKDFPYNVEKAVLGKVSSEPKGPQREMRIIRKLFGKILASLQKLHAVGIVHRDIKPQNMIFNSETGALKVIDLGAAADLRVGINYNPNEFLLDPRYAAPEQYIMSTQTPKAPPPVVATTLSPVLWQLNLPDRFDIYSAGLIFIQMCFPSLRTDSGLIQFNRQLKRCDYDLAAWREQAEKRNNPDLARGFELMDLNGGLGWQLVQAMMRFEGRQRISASVALLHPFFDPTAPTFLQQVRLGLLRAIYRDNLEVSKQLLTFMAREPEDTGAFTEMSLQKFRREERKKLKDTLDRNAKAVAWKVSRRVSKVSRTLSSTFGGQEDEGKKDAWWNRWQSQESATDKA